MFTGEKFQNPGPGAYRPEKAPPLNSDHRAPAYTMGARTRYRCVDAVPAPNRLRRCFLFLSVWFPYHDQHGHSTIIAIYPNVLIPSKHVIFSSFSENDRAHISDVIFPQKINSRRFPNSVVQNGLCCSFAGCFLLCSYTLPNLLGCHVPQKPSSASYSFSSRRKVGAPSEDLSMSPGPAKYNSTDPDVYHQRQPSFSMQSRTKRPNYSFANPGPGTYSPEKFHVHLPRQPSYTLGVRHSEFVTPLVVDVVDWFSANVLYLFSFHTNVELPQNDETMFFKVGQTGHKLLM